MRVIRRPRSQAGKAEDARDRSAMRLAAALGSLALFAVAAPAAGRGTSDAAAADPLAVVSEVVDQRPSEVREYWTRERMRQAEPLELRDLADTRLPPSRPPAPEPLGEPKLVLPSGPGVPETRGGILDGVLDDVLGGGSPQTRAAVDASANNTGFPRRVHGKVFATLEDVTDATTCFPSSAPCDIDFLCSATVVRSRSHVLVWTAGHCVNGSDVGTGFATNFEFVPGYRDGSRPFGEWAAKRLLTTSGWQSNSNIRFDAAAAVLARDREGRGVQDVIGARGIAFNQSRNQTFVAYGYPAEPTVFNPGFNGQHLFTCTSARLGNDEPSGGTGPSTMRINCDMTGGSSGGGWVVDNKFVNSVTSYGYDDDPNSLYGPYFGTSVKNLYRESRGKRRKCGGKEVTNLGGAGGDDFDGTSRADSFKLRGGPDTGRGGPGSDRVCGGKGKDLLIGGPGFDVCNGGKGRDRARGCEERRKIR
jgi:V8-like Glu-specific endopeptidase